MRAPFLLLLAVGVLGVTAQNQETELELLERIDDNHVNECAEGCLRDYVEYKKRDLWVKAYTKLMGRPPQGPSPGSNFGGGSNVWRDDIPSGSRSFGPGAAGSGRGGGGGGRPPLTPDEQALLGIDPNSARARLTPDEQALLGLSGRGAGGDLQAPQLRQGNFFADPLNAVAPGEMADVRGGPDNPRTYSGAGAGARADRRIPSGPGKLGAKKPMLITCLARCERDNDGFVVFSPHVERVLVVEATIGYGECRQQTNQMELCEEMWTFGRIKPNKNALQFRREDLINNLRSLRTMDVRGAIGGSMNRVRSQLSNMRQAMPKVPTPEGVVRSMCNSGADKVNSGPGARTVGAPAQPPKAPVAPRRR